jgi:hypothetical protein
MSTNVIPKVRNKGFNPFIGIQGDHIGDVKFNAGIYLKAIFNKSE